MKKTTIMFAIMLGVACTASAQKTGKKKAQKSVKTEQVSNVSSDQEEKLTLTKEVYPAEGREQQPLSRLDQEADLRPHDSTSWFGSDL